MRVACVCVEEDESFRRKLGGLRVTDLVRDKGGTRTTRNERDCPSGRRQALERLDECGGLRGSGVVEFVGRV